MEKYPNQPRCHHGNIRNLGYVCEKCVAETKANMEFMATQERVSQSCTMCGRIGVNTQDGLCNKCFIQKLRAEEENTRLAQQQDPLTVEALREELNCCKKRCAELSEEVSRIRTEKDAWESNSNYNLHIAQTFQKQKEEWEEILSTPPKLLNLDTTCLTIPVQKDFDYRVLRRKKPEIKPLPKLQLGDYLVFGDGTQVYLVQQDGKFVYTDGKEIFYTIIRGDVQKHYREGKLIWEKSK